MILALIGVSYAAYTYSREGTKVNTITTGSITMTYTESSNTISLTGALPTTDKTGKVRLNPGEYFDFTVSSKISGNININYEISAKKESGTLEDKYIKLYLTRIREDGTEEELMSPENYNEEASSNEYTGRPANEMSLYTSSMSSSESNKYRLRMYVDEGYNPQDDGGNLTFSVKINVYGLDGLSLEDRMMMAYDFSNPSDFHTDEYKSKITSIVTKGDTVIPEGVIESWDISEKQNGSVIAYIEADGSGLGTYKVTIGGEGRIIANYDMNSYFSDFTNLISIYLSFLDTGLTTDMGALFGATYRLTTLDLSNFDTSNVTTMLGMFAGDTQTMALEKIIFGKKFDTSNVTQMAAMFSYCPNLVSLDLTSFDTSNVTNSRFMFAHTKSLTEILVTRDKWTISNSVLTSTSGVTDFTYV